MVHTMKRKISTISERLPGCKRHRRKRTGKWSGGCYQDPNAKYLCYRQPRFVFEQDQVHRGIETHSSDRKLNAASKKKPDREDFVSHVKKGTNEGFKGLHEKHHMPVMQSPRYRNKRLLSTRVYRTTSVAQLTMSSKRQKSEPRHENEPALPSLALP